MVDNGLIAHYKREADAAFEKGLNAGMNKNRESEIRYVKAFGDRLMTYVSKGIVQSDEAKSSPGSYGRFARAIEHMVSDIDPTNAATPHGIVTLGQSEALPLAASWTDDSMRAATYATLVEVSDGRGLPQVPVMVTKPTAGDWQGEKHDAYSRAFDINSATSVPNIVATLYLNVSATAEASPGTLAVIQALMRAAVASEASSQIVAAMIAGGSSGADIGAAFGSFAGSRFAPSVAVIPPAEVMTIDASNLAACGVRLAIDPAATAVIVADPMATYGWLRRMSAQAAEPSTFGYGISFGIIGNIAVDDSGVATVA